MSSRRRFLQYITGAIIFFLLLRWHRSLQALLSRPLGQGVSAKKLENPFVEEGKTLVSIVHGDDVDKMVRQEMELLGGWEKIEVKGKRVLVIEDGPTLTHGEMTYGAGVVAARQHGAAEIVDPRPYAVGKLAETFRKYPKTGPVLPAMGYGEEQTRDLEATVKATPCDLVVIGTPIDLRRIISFDKPTVRVTYDLAERGKPDLAEVLAPILAR